MTAYQKYQNLINDNSFFRFIIYHCNFYLRITLKAELNFKKRGSYPAQHACYCISFTTSLMKIFNINSQFGNFRKVSFKLFFSQQNQFPEMKNKYISNSALKLIFSKISSSLSSNQSRNTLASVG